MNETKCLYITKINDIIYIKYEDNLDDYIKLFTYNNGMEVAARIAIEWLEKCRIDKPPKE